MHLVGFHYENYVICLQACILSLNTFTSLLAYTSLKATIVYNDTLSFDDIITKFNSNLRHLFLFRDQYQQHNAEELRLEV